MMPLTAAVQDLSHCGRGQRGIDFFFKSSPVLTPTAAQEKRDILAYFEKVEVRKEQEEQSYVSFSNNTDDTDCSLFSSEEEEVKPRKNGKVRTNKTKNDSSDNCNKNVDRKENGKVVKKLPVGVGGSVGMTEEGERGGEDRLSVKGRNVKACYDRNTSHSNTKVSSNSDNNDNEQPSPAVIVDLTTSKCDEEADKGETPSNGRTSKNKEYLEVEINEATKMKIVSPQNVTETKKNVFTLMMSNRARKFDTGKSSTEEPHNSGDDDIKCVVNNDECEVVSVINPQKCEAVTKSTKNLNPVASKTTQKVKSGKDCDKTTNTAMNKKSVVISKKNSQNIESDKEKQNAQKATDLNSSLEDFDLTLQERNNKSNEGSTDTKPRVGVASPSDSPDHNPEEKSPSLISFAEYMKCASSMPKQVTIEENLVEKMEEVKSEDSTSKCKLNETQTQQQQQTPNNSCKSIVNDQLYPKNVLKENVNSPLESDVPTKKRKYSCSSETLAEKQVQNDCKNTEAAVKAEQTTEKAKRKRTKKKILMSSDSEEDFLVSKDTAVSKKKEDCLVSKDTGVSKKKEDSKSCDKPPVVSHTAKISSFFKKINQKGKDEEEKKVVFTVQADVHAPLDGNEDAARKAGSPVQSEACVEADVAVPNCVKKSTRRNKNLHDNCATDELNKIELLEQVPPSKLLSKKNLNNVCDEKKDLEVEESKPVKTEACSSVRLKRKETVDAKTDKTTNKRTLTRRTETQKETKDGARKLLRRRKPRPASSEEESSDEIFFKKEKNKPVEKDKNVKSSNSSISIGSVDNSPEGTRDSSLNTLQSSPETSEDDKENVAHYTSQLVTQPGKLSLRIRRVHLPQETPRKVKGKQNKAKKKIAQLKKVKCSKINSTKRKLRNSPKHKSLKGKAAAASTTQANPELITLDDDADNKKKKQTCKKTTKRGKVSQTLLKPLLPKSCSKGRLQKSAALSQAGPGKTKSELQGGLQRRTLRRAAASAKRYIEEAIIDEEDDKPKKSQTTRMLISKKSSKLAPIFCKRAASPGVELLKVVPLSPSKLKARQEFLNSSVSDDIRKQLAVEKSDEDETGGGPPFPAVSHVQQQDEGTPPWNLKEPQIPLKEEPCYFPSLEGLSFTLDQKVFTQSSARRKESPCHVPRLHLEDIVFSLGCMKSKFPNFPAYQVFKAYYDLKKEAVETYRKEIQKEQTVVHLDDDEEEEEEEGRCAAKRRKRKRKNKPSTLSRGKRRKLGCVRETVVQTPQHQQEQLQSVWHEKTPHMWTQIFMPQNAKQVIGNTENVKKLKLWLQEWKNNPQIKPRKRKKKSSRKDDFVISDDSSLGSEEIEFVGTYLLCGPPGAGKTAAVYALAKELGYKVLEVNASSRRPGRQVMSQLAEATQSHSVSNTSSTSHSSNAFSALFATRTSTSATKKENRPMENTSTNGDSNKMKGVSLVLFEDIDIVFDEWDEGFMSTVNNLISTTKRPIILTATHATSTLLAQIKESFEVMEFVLPPQRLTAQHLQVVALANGCHVCLQDVEWLVHLNKGDIRKSMLDLQLLSQSGSSHDLCDCALSEDAMSDPADDSWRNIFPEVETLAHKKLNQMKFYKVGLQRRYNAETTLNASVTKTDSECILGEKDIIWKEIESDISYILPLPINEQEKPVLKYPLQPNDPLLKRSVLWQYESLICSDGEEEKK